MPTASSSWKIKSSSVIGTSHLRCGAPCQDAHQTRVLDDGTLLIAIADGAGSASRSDQGSAIASREALNALEWGLSEFVPTEENQWRSLLHRALDDARAALENTASGSPLRDFATTLLLVVVTRDILATLQLGDGAIVCRERYGILRVLTPVTDSEYINVTTFLTGDSFRQDTFIQVLPAESIDAIAVFSDGVQYIAIQYPANTAHPGFFDPLFRFAAADETGASALESFLSSPQVTERTDDDKTLVLAVRDVSS